MSLLNELLVWWVAYLLCGGPTKNLDRSKSARGSANGAVHFFMHRSILPQETLVAPDKPETARRSRGRGRAEFGTAARDAGCGRSSVRDLSRQFCSEKVDLLDRG